MWTAIQRGQRRDAIRRDAALPAFAGAVLLPSGLSTTIDRDAPQHLDLRLSALSGGPDGGSLDFHAQRLANPFRIATLVNGDLRPHGESLVRK